MPFKVGVQLHPQATTVENLRAAWKAADEMGVDSIWVWDHFFPLYGDRDGAHFECFSMLAAMADATSRIELGPLVACNSYRNPQLLADITRTIDHISGGRMILGVGAGWFQRDHEAYGYEFGTVGSRLGALERDVPRMLARLAQVNPRPIRRVPLLIAGVGERRTLRLVARYADGWHATFPERPEELEPKVAALRRWCDEEGRDPAEIEWGLGVEPEDIERFFASDAATYVQMGFTQFTLGFNGPRWDVENGVGALAWRDRVNELRSAA